MMNTAEIIDILNRPVRQCEMAHEDMQRDINGEPLLPLALNPECPLNMKHIGCYHLLVELLQETAFGQYLLSNDTDLYWHVRNQANALGQCDSSIRVARAGIKHTIMEIDQKPDPAKLVPTIAQGAENAESFLETQRKVLERIEVVRVSLLGIAMSLLEKESQRME